MEPRDGKEDIKQGKGKGRTWCTYCDFAYQIDKYCEKFLRSSMVNKVGHSPQKLNSGNCSVLKKKV